MLPTAIERDALDLITKTSLKMIPKLRDPSVPVNFETLISKLRRPAEPHNIRHIFRPTPSPIFLPTPTNEWLKTSPLTKIKSTHALRRMKFVATNTQKIDGNLTHIHRCFPHRLNRIRVKSIATRLRDLTKLGDRLNHARLIVRPHDARKPMLRAIAGHLKFVDLHSAL